MGTAIVALVALGMGTGAFRMGLIALAAAIPPALGPAWAGGSVVLEGTYLRDRICTGRDDNAEPVRVKITHDSILYRGGACSIGDRSEAANSVTMRVNCRFDSGLVLSSDISFTVRDDKTVDMTQKDGSYTAVLKRCPGAE